MWKVAMMNGVESRNEAGLKGHLPAMKATKNQLEIRNT